MRRALDKLSPQELQQLNGWIDSHGGSTVKYVSASGTPVFYPKSSERETIDAHIDGLFTGWRGKTVFTLDNGQQWKQSEGGVIDAGKMQSPKVKIKPMLMGNWLMYVDGCGCNIHVERIK